MDDETAARPTPTDQGAGDDAFAALVAEVLAPLVGTDGGTIAWAGRAGSTARVRLGGACIGCPGRASTSAVILRALQSVDPSIDRIEILSAD